MPTSGPLTPMHEVQMHTDRHRQKQTDTETQHTDRQTEHNPWGCGDGIVSNMLPCTSIKLCLTPSFHIGQSGHTPAIPVLERQRKGRSLVFTGQPIYHQ